MLAECAFGQRKETWRLLCGKSEVNQHSLKVNVLACFVLHKICIEKLVTLVSNYYYYCYCFYSLKEKGFTNSYLHE